MSFRKLFISAIFLALICGTTMSVLAKGWEKIATMPVDRYSNHATILNPNLWDKKFRMIKLAVAKAPIRILRVVVTFGNDETVESKVSDLIADGGESMEMGIKGDRHVKRVDFWYEPASLGSKKAQVTLWAFNQ